MERLGLSDDELCAVLDADPISVITDELDHRPEVAILLDLTAEAEERAGGEVLRRWLRGVTLGVSPPVGSERGVTLGVSPPVGSEGGDTPGTSPLGGPHPHRRPIDLLLARDFAAFEDALAELAQRGFVLRGGGARGR